MAQYSVYNMIMRKFQLFNVCFILLFLFKIYKAKAFTPTFFSPKSACKETILHCQLLGLNARNPTSFNFSFKGFSLRGGCTDVHCHGWGIAIYEGRGLRMFHDPEPCASSPIAELVTNLEIKTHNTIAHIRYATFGEVCLANVHPFQREMFGIQWTFAHNGDVPLFKKDHEAQLPWIGKHNGDRIYNPVGETDSEKIFCCLLNAIKAKFKETMPEMGELFRLIEETLDEIVEDDKESTILNFLMGIGSQYQLAYSWPGKRPGSKVWNGLYYVVREHPFKRTALIDCDYEVDFSKLAGEKDQVSIITTKPLTYNEDWIEFEPGQLILFDSGTPKVIDKLSYKHSLKEDRRRYDKSSGVSSFLGSCI